MKNVMFYVLIMCIVGSTKTIAQDKWDYPTKPGSPEWQKLSSQVDKVRACQIPDDILSKISTQDLVELCLNYPLLLNITIFSTFDDGLNRYIEDFNGIRELLRRNESAVILAERFKKLSVNKLDPNWSILQKGKYAYDIMFIELILSQEIILKYLSRDDLKLLLINSIEKYSDKKNAITIYGEQSLNSICLLISSILLQIDPQGALFSLQEIQDIHARMNMNMSGIKDYIPKIDKLVNDVNRIMK